MISHLPMLLLVLTAIGLVLPLCVPLPRLSQRVARFGFQLLHAVGGLALGWWVIAPKLWQMSGGCAAHGGNFEGACGYADLAGRAFAALITATALVLVSGIVIAWCDYRANLRRQTNKQANE